MDNKQARYLHRMLDRLAEGKNLSPEEIALLRKELPELPIQKTLEEISWDVHFAWCETSGNDWKEELFGDLETWLSEQHSQLRAHLEGVNSQAHPPHPEFLETEADYAAAPEGTIVAYEDSSPWHKFDSTWLSTAVYEGNNAKGMTGVIRRVLRWGDGE